MPMIVASISINLPRNDVTVLISLLDCLTYKTKYVHRYKSQSLNMYQCIVFGEEVALKKINVTRQE